MKFSVNKSDNKDNGKLYRVAKSNFGDSLYLLLEGSFVKWVENSADASVFSYWEAKENSDRFGGRLC